MKWCKTSHWPILLLFVVIVVVYFRNYFFLGLVPVPFDIIAGIYYPWRDYQWGYAVAVPVKNPLPSDIPSQLYPFRILVANLIRQHILPLWNPYILSGSPLLANFQSAVFYPTMLLFFVFSNITAWSIGIILQPFISLIAMYAFLFNLTKQKIPSVFGAIVFSFSGVATIWLFYNTHGHVMYWLPLLLLAIDKYREKRHGVWLLLISLMVAFQIFAGYPLFVIFNLLTAFGYTIFRFRILGELRSIVLILSSIGLGLMLAVVQLLPGYEFLAQSNRLIDTTKSANGYLPWQNLITFLIPDFFGNPATGNYWGKGVYDDFAGYVGILPIIFATLAFFTSHKDRLFFGLLLLISLLLCLPIPGVFLHQIPILGIAASIPARALYLTDFSLAVLACFGLSWLQSTSSKGIFKAIRLALYYLTAITVLVLILVATRYGVNSNCGGVLKAECLNEATAIRNSVIPLVILAFGLVGMVLTLLLPSKKQFFVIIFMAITLIDLFRFGNKYLSFTPQRLDFPETPSIQALKKVIGTSRFDGGDAIPPNLWMPYSFQSASGYDAYYSLRYAQFLALLNSGQASKGQGRYGDITNIGLSLFDLTGTKYLFALKWTKTEEVRPYGEVRQKFSDSKFKEVLSDQSVAVLENSKALPRAFLVGHYIVGRTDQAVAQVLTEIDLASNVVLEKDIGTLRYSTGSAQIKSYQANTVSITTRGNGDALLFLSDSYFPGWQATIDGNQTEVLRADFVFRAVKVPAGDHLVTFIYRPKSFYLGLKITLFALCTLVVLSIGLALQSRRARL